MTYHLYGSPDTLAIGVSRPLIKASQRQEFSDAMDLCAALKAMQADMNVRNHAAHEQAKIDGFTAGQTAATDHMAQALTALQEQLTQFETQVQDQIASAAYAATQAIIGKLPDDIVLSGIVNEAIARLASQNDAITNIEISPSMLDRIASHLPQDSATKLVANTSLSQHDCVIVTTTGRLVASLDVQMESLAKRWGVPMTSDETEPADEISQQSDHNVIA